MTSSIFRLRAAPAAGMGGWRFETGTVQERRERSFDSLCSLRMTGKGDLAWIRRRMAQRLRKTRGEQIATPVTPVTGVAMTCFERRGADPRHEAQDGASLSSVASRQLPRLGEAQCVRSRAQAGPVALGRTW